jgi:hypothetical protein
VTQRFDREAERRDLHALASALGAASNLAMLLREEYCEGGASAAAPAGTERTRRMHDALRASLDRAITLLRARRDALLVAADTPPGLPEWPNRPTA